MAEPEPLRVALGQRGYDIIIGGRLLARAGRYMAPLLRNPRVIIITDANVARLYLHRLTGALEEQGIASRSIILPAGEGTKSLASFSDLLEQLLAQKPDRNTMLVALGGGVIGDITGFAASVLLRGVEFIQIPTTLLAQVDSSVGGKTGINSQFGKNLIGSFHQPALVLSDVATLSTLPKRELLAGYAETVKYGLINDAAFFGWLEAHAADMLSAPSPTLPPLGGGSSEALPLKGGGLGGGASLLTHAIRHCCSAKAAIVSADEKEHGVRALLNFGHTFAHAFEAETGYGEALLHGEAVAIGMVLALRLSVAMGLCPPADLERLLAHYAATGLPATPRAIRAEWDTTRLMEHFTRDKKAKDGKLTFILAHGIGKAFITQAVDITRLQDVLIAAC